MPDHAPFQDLVAEPGLSGDHPVDPAVPADGQGKDHFALPMPVRCMGKALIECREDLLDGRPDLVF